MKTLEEIYSNYSYPVGDGDKGTLHSYIDMYSYLLEKYREGSTFLEIGVSWGYSMQMWMDYFINSTIIGVEKSPQYTNPNCLIETLMQDERCKILIDDATDESILDRLPDLYFDVIIDDGSHEIQDQVNSFNIFKSRMKPGSIYIIEDIDDLYSTEGILRSLHHNCQIIDNRGLKGRYDDVLVIYRF